MIKGRDDLFRAFLDRDPTKEELQRLDRMGDLMGISKEDSLWYAVLVNELYDDRLKNRLEEVDRVAGDAADKALERIAEAVAEKADSLAARKDNGFMMRSWGFMMSFIVLLCAAVFNAGYIAGSGQISRPFWLKAESGLSWILGWFLSVPSGWILFLGSGPFLFELYRESTKKITANKRFGVRGEENIVLYIKSITCLTALCFIGLTVFYLTVLNAIFS